jgi:hypothetical protein
MVTVTFTHRSVYPSRRIMLPNPPAVRLDRQEVELREELGEEGRGADDGGTSVPPVPLAPAERAALLQMLHDDARAPASRAAEKLAGSSAQVRTDRQTVTRGGWA